MVRSRPVRAQLVAPLLEHVDDAPRLVELAPAQEERVELAQRLAA